MRYNKNTYTLTFSIRMAEGRLKPIPSKDGVIPEEYAIALEPEAAEATGLKIDRCALSVEETWSAEDGGVWKYTAETLVPTSGEQVKLVTVTYENGNPIFTPIDPVQSPNG